VTVDAAEAPEWFTEAMLEGIYGQVNILTGKITRIGVECISYDINTYGSCSGTTVCLLGQGPTRFCERSGRLIPDAS